MGDASKGGGYSSVSGCWTMFMCGGYAESGSSECVTGEIVLG